MTFFLSDSYRLTVSTSFLALVGHQVLAVWLFDAHRIWFPMVIPSAALLLTVGVSALVQYTLVGRSRSALRSAFSRYVCPELVVQLVNSETPPSLGGEELRATVFFSDIAGFTTMVVESGWSPESSRCSMPTTRR